MLSCSLLILAGCDRSAPPAESQTPPPPAASEAPPPPEVRSSDPGNATTDRAAPPTLKPVAIGSFEPGNPVAEAVTGRLSIEDGKIEGGNGASFVTERVALVRGGDEYGPGQRYADTMMIDAGQPVELRRVIDETPPTATTGSALCGRNKTSYIALAKVEEGDDEVVKLIGLQGDDLPAAGAQGITLCASTFYLAKR